VGALGPLGKVAGRRWRWAAQVGLYTLAGSLSSAPVGLLLGAIGQALGAGTHPFWSVVGAVWLLALLMRSMGRWRFPLPQWRRQTRDLWAKVFPAEVAAVLWGLDLGLAFTTWITFTGYWGPVGIAFLLGQPARGAGLFLTYWWGRAALVWASPQLFPGPMATPTVMDALAQQRSLFQRLHRLGLGLMILGLVLLETRP
jgi:hypothetical protein